MARRTKEELHEANYYKWLEYCNSLREKKKNGEKLTPHDKQILRTIPSPEAPFIEPGQEPVKKVKRPKPPAKIEFDANAVWPVKGDHFLCAVFNAPFTDEQCILFCERDDCPFHGKGYFRMHGMKF